MSKNSRVSQRAFLSPMCDCDGGDGRRRKETVFVRCCHPPFFLLPQPCNRQQGCDSSAYKRCTKDPDLLFLLMVNIVCPVIYFSEGGVGGFSSLYPCFAYKSFNVASSGNRLEVLYCPTPLVRYMSPFKYEPQLLMCSTKPSTFSSTSAQFMPHSDPLSHVFGRPEPYVTISVVFICIYMPSFLPLVHDFSSLEHAPHAAVARPYSCYHAQPPRTSGSDILTNWMVMKEGNSRVAE